MIKNTIYVPGIGYRDYIQVLPSFNNYFGQRVMNFGFRNLKDGSGPGTGYPPGTCESAYLWSPARCATSDPCDKYIGSNQVHLLKYTYHQNRTLGSSD